MGEVYRARDTRLDRTVAIKVLPDTLDGGPRTSGTVRPRSPRDFAAHTSAHLHAVRRRRAPRHGVPRHGVSRRGDAGRQAREGRAAARSGAQDRDRDRSRARQGASRRHRPPRSEARQHHADQGWRQAARLRTRQEHAPIVAGAGQSMLPTTPPNLTAQGTILGTFQYMAPEQIEGQEADARTDIFAFGAVLYEMSAGRKAFEGKTRRALSERFSRTNRRPVHAAAALARLARTHRQEVPGEGSGRSLAVRFRSARRAGVDHGRQDADHRHRGGRGKAVARVGRLGRGIGRAVVSRFTVLAARLEIAWHARRCRRAGDASADRHTARRQPRGALRFRRTAGHLSIKRPRTAAHSSGFVRLTRTRRGRWTAQRVRLRWRRSGLPTVDQSDSSLSLK